MAAAPLWRRPITWRGTSRSCWWQRTFGKLDELALDPAARKYPSLAAATTKAIQVYSRANAAAVSKVRGDEAADEQLFMGKSVLSRISGKWYNGVVIEITKSGNNPDTDFAIQMITVKFSFDNTRNDCCRERIQNDIKNFDIAKNKIKDGDRGSARQNSELDFGVNADRAGNDREEEVKELLRKELPSADQLQQEAKELIEPVWDYYRNIYLAEGAKMSHVRKAIRAASVFNFDILSVATVASATPLIEALGVFGFPELTDGVLAGIVAELHAVLAAARSPFNWSELPDAKEYDADADGGDGDAEAWRKDPAEKARRFWLRWVEWCYPTQRFPHFATAVRLVVLVQPSSAAIERCFSQLKLIVEETG